MHQLSRGNHRWVRVWLLQEPQRGPSVAQLLVLTVVSARQVSAVSSVTTASSETLWVRADRSERVVLASAARTLTPTPSGTVTERRENV